jgi:amino acid transporter
VDNTLNGTAKTALHKVGPLALTAILYFTVSGGPFGLEPAVGAAGPAMALALILLVPLLSGLPTALMVAELSAAMPVEGGFYRWVERAMGRFWGFQEAWWSFISALPDMAIYPVLFVGYVDQSVHLSGPAKFAVALGVIWIGTALNILGVGAVGATAVVSGVLVVAPFILFSVLGWHVPAAPIVWSAHGKSAEGGFLAALSIVLWNYTGWDNISLVGDEVENPQRSYPIALLGGLALIVATYVGPLLAGLRMAPDPASWTEGAFPSLARAMPGGRWLSMWLLAGALVSTFTLFNSLMLSYSRLPMVLAEDGYFPKFMARTNKRGVPVMTLVISSIFYSLLALMSYTRLAVLYALVYTLSIILEFLALWILRLREPGMDRPFRVPGGMAGLIYAVVTPLAVSAIVVGFTLWQGIKEPLWCGLAVLAAASGWPAWWLLRGRRAPETAVVQE